MFDRKILSLTRTGPEADRAVAAGPGPGNRHLLTDLCNCSDEHQLIGNIKYLLAVSGLG
jgi:hypothetical protein